VGAARERRLDALALVVAGAVDLLAGADAALLLADGTVASGGDVADRIDWVSDHADRWRLGWAFWVIVTTTFAWAFYALARNLAGRRQWRDLALGAAVLAAAVDLVGIAINVAVLPDLATRLQELDGDARASALATYAALEDVARALTDVSAYGLYTAAGLLLLPALLDTPGYPRALAVIAIMEWGLAAVVTALLALGSPAATGPFAVALVLYVPWAWGSAWWLYSGYHGR
jgi:hypothetical protein